MSPTAKKLDKILSNESWILSFLASLAHFLATDFFDHSPGLVNLNCALPIAGSKPFKFFNYLTNHPGLLHSVISGWESSDQAGWSLSRLSKMQKVLKKTLRSLNKNNFSWIQKRVGETMKHLKVVQVISFSNPTEATSFEEKLCKEKLNMLKRLRMCISIRNLESSGLIWAIKTQATSSKSQSLGVFTMQSMLSLTSTASL